MKKHGTLTAPEEFSKITSKLRNLGAGNWLDGKYQTVDEQFSQLSEMPEMTQEKLRLQLELRKEMQRCKFLSVAEAAFYLGFSSVKLFQDRASRGEYDSAISRGGNGRQFHRETLDRIMLQKMKQAVNA